MAGYRQADRGQVESSQLRQSWNGRDDRLGDIATVCGKLLQRFVAKFFVSILVNEREPCMQSYTENHQGHDKE